MRNRNKKRHNGFIALMSAIIISVILLLLLTTLSFNNFYSRFNILDSELKERSFSIAEACVDTAILNLISDPTFSGNATTTVMGSDQCYIGPVTVVGTQKVFKTRAIYSNSHTNLLVKTNSTSFNIDYIEETPTF